MGLTVEPDALEALLTRPLSGRRSPSSGLKVSDILSLSEDQQTLVNWLIRHYEGTLTTLADHLGQREATLLTHLEDLRQHGYVYTLDRQGVLYYRVKLAPKSGRQMPTDVWQVLDRNSEQANVFISYARRNKDSCSSCTVPWKPLGARCGWIGKVFPWRGTGGRKFRWALSWRIPSCL